MKRKADAEIQQAVERELECVHSWQEREAVLGAVKGTRGVRTIAHTIRVDPSVS